TVGAASVAADAEICAMLADALEAVGIERGDYVIRVNNRKVLNGVMEAVLPTALDIARDKGITRQDAALRREELGASVLRTIDKFDKVGAHGVEKLLGNGLRDGSGAFIEGVGLEQGAIKGVLQYLETRSVINRANDTTQQAALPYSESDTNSVVLKNLRLAVGNSSEGAEGVAELETIAALLDAQGYGPDRIIIDPSVVRGLGYYTGPVYEAELTFEITDEKGRPRQFGSVAGGGRYDDLVKRFTGQSVPATGVSIGVDRLLAALAAKGRGEADAPGPVVVTVMDRDRMADYFALVNRLRAAGIRAEPYLGNPKNFGNQLKYADKRRAPVAIIQGSDEAARGVVQVKDLILGAKIAEEATVEEWKSQPAQIEVPVDRMVAEVRRILDRG
ncbi:MAG: histidine--tRNA ligase, partial [Rhodobacteraceae bacterium]|nr:histidine--tRNA ligase [Paracoccaceae bacterium]